MYICKDCDYIFENGECYTETHGLDSPPYEEYHCCPICGETYSDAFKCDCCDKYIIGTYIKTKKGQRFCENCYVEGDTYTD